MFKLGQMAMRTAVLAGSVASLLQMLPDQPLKAQLIDLATACAAEADAMVTTAEFEEQEPSGIKAA